VHASFYSYRSCEPVPKFRMLRDCLDYAIDLHQSPGNHTSPPYSAGSAAYPAWINAIRAGSGDSHGNWWNAQVWSECRKQAGAFFKELKPAAPEAGETCRALARDFAAIGDLIQRCGDATVDSAEKIKLLEEARTIEERALPGLDALRSACHPD